MKTSQNFGLIYFLLLIGQIVLCNYTNLGPFVMLSMLPAMILCVPTGVGVITCMLLAFVSGFCTDWLSEGILGLNAAALLPVALARKGIIRIFLGEDIIARKDSFSVRKSGLGKVTLTMSAATAIFLAVYILLDGAGTRPFWFCFSKFAVSLACNWPIGLIVINALVPDDRK